MELIQSPLEKLMQQTQTLNKQAEQEQQQQQQPKLQQQQQQPKQQHLKLPNQQPFNRLSDISLRSSTNLPPPPPSRRPSIGRVNSSTATTQTPREHITSLYGDQQTILPTTNLTNDQHRLTWISSHSSQYQDEYNSESARYASGHSITDTSDDPFQYWQYEASRQSRDLLASRSILASLKPATRVSTTLPPDKPNNRVLSTNFSRPIRPSSSMKASPTEISPSPSFSREISPGDSPREASLEIPPHSNSIPPVHTKDILSTVSTKHQPGSSSSIRTLTHPSRSSLKSRSSIDTNSSTSSRRSWKKVLHIGGSRSKGDDESVARQDQPTESDHHYHHNNHDSLRSSCSEYSSNLPAITFTQSQHEPDIYETSFNSNQSDYDYQQQQQQHHHHHHRSQKAAHHSSLEQPLVEVQRMGQTSYCQPQESPTSPHDQDLQQLQRTLPHRLSIYSLPSCDERIAEDPHDKLRYASRSPLSFDSPSSSQVPSPSADFQGQMVTQQVKFTDNPSTHLQAAPGGGTTLHSAIAKAKASLANTDGKTSSAKQTAQDYLQAGILAHEQGDLERSAGLFERAAREGGGCGAGMLMWGLSLRHGWGCQVHEARAFKWLQKAAESVIEDLDSAVSSSSRNKSVANAAPDQSKDAVAKSELVLAIYELGQCFMRGWGCKKDKQLAINYFELAAKLGDPDAQQELGFCYANGKGTKKDLKLAAKYYRLAAAQGVEMMGSQWIWKDKREREN
ncbi:hypothetical protein VP01_613g3 [Puccinia sorghi]|uniref:HCP-like protein n=1 Tax=Puccinia sorghi TaxID=27349 RepID=A0A0L6UGX9_9BASI|nr:hypothetical protein VP01_613g3 [Puccinia sorghi]